MDMLESSRQSPTIGDVTPIPFRSPSAAGRSDSVDSIKMAAVPPPGGYPYQAPPTGIMKLSPLRPFSTDEGFHKPVHGRAITGSSNLAPNYPPPRIQSPANVLALRNGGIADHSTPPPLKITVNLTVPPPGLHAPPPPMPPGVPHPTLAVPPPTLSVPPPSFLPPTQASRPDYSIELHMRLEESYEQFR